MQTDVYNHIGKLFYAIAKADGKLTIEEYRKLNEILDSSWNHIDIYFITTTKHSFNELHLNNIDASQCFEDFISYYESHTSLFGEDLKSLILKTSNEIAYAFAKINKSELILLAKLSIAFKKINHEK